MTQRKFGGKLYNLIGSEKARTKREAESLAKSIRKDGGQARVVEAPEKFKVSTRHFNNYCVYARK